MNELMMMFIDNKFIELLMLVICADMVLGILRAIRYRQFNSSVGIDGAIRKVAMITSVCILMAADCLIHVNLLSFLPEAYISLLGIRKVGLCELFCLIFIAYECISVLKNMLLCGLPVPKGLKGWLEEFLENMTAEMPETRNGSISESRRDSMPEDVQKGRLKDGQSMVTDGQRGGERHG